MNIRSHVIKLLRRFWREVLLFGVVGIVIAPLFYYGTPAYAYTPDVLYLKGKLLQVLAGNIYADPVTGFDTMHPPIFHLFLAPFAAIGVKPDTLLILSAAINVILMAFFAYRIVRHIFDPDVGLITGLLLPFIIGFMGSRGLLLAAAFNFSVPIYLAGLWLYLVSGRSHYKVFMAALLWGIAFIITPVYLFLIGLTLVYEAVVRREFRRFLIMVGALALTASPFIYQVIYIYSKGLWGADVFSLWRGVPDISNIDVFASDFLAPITNDVLNPGTAIHAAILILAIYTIIRRRHIHWFIPVAFVAYVLTYYHYKPQYATRIQLFMSIFVAATAVYGLRMIFKGKTIWALLVSVAIILGVYEQMAEAVETHRTEQRTYNNFIKPAQPLWENIPLHVEEGSRVFCNKETYVYHILPRVRVHSLGAYTTMDYFQMQSDLADMLERDLRTAWLTNDYAITRNIARKYDIKYAIFGPKDRQVPIYHTLTNHWETVYDDGKFKILKKPE